MKVLIVDDSKYSTTLIKVVIKKMGHEVIGEANTVSEARKMIQILKPDLITLDHVLNDMKGTDVFAGLSSIDPRKVIVISGSEYDSTAAQYKRYGVNNVLCKPIDPIKLQNAISQVSPVGA